LPHLRGVWGKIGGACPTATSADFQLKNILKYIFVV